jgi:hypothetical protein
MSRTQRVYSAQDAAVSIDCRGAPCALNGTEVETIREEWIVEDGWWTARPLHRHYFELVLADGRGATVFRDVRTGRWHRQAA